MSEGSHNHTCPDCGSSTALSVYNNGTHCHSCNTTTFFDDNDTDITEFKKQEHSVRMSEIETGGEFVDLKGDNSFLNRGIDKDVCETYGVKVLKDNNGAINKVVFPFYDSEKNYKAQDRDWETIITF